MAPEFFASIMTPGIALLILSTTMRLGNVRAALTELVRSTPPELELLESYRLFRDRSNFLCAGLRLLNLALLALLCAAMLQVFVLHKFAYLQSITLGVNLLSLLLLFVGVVYLFLESRLTGRSIIALTNDMQALSKKDK
ncbi:hypothetical protein [Agaribacter flavus]|uniref:DUF2721 domain-containing protein n=1 Tax=Agaribacter flavus TaxID=1902781 RepID=A0ABV7FRL6_9ALTE